MAHNLFDLFISVYLAEIGCSAVSDPLSPEHAYASSWYWRGCSALAPCDPKLASPKLCTLNKIGDIAMYANIGFALAIYISTGYRIYKNNKRNSLNLGKR